MHACTYHISVKIHVLLYMYVLPVEALFGTPPFASKTLEELEMKLLDTKPIEVSIIHFVQICEYVQCSFLMISSGVNQLLITVAMFFPYSNHNLVPCAPMESQAYVIYIMYIWSLIYLLVVDSSVPHKICNDYAQHR